jgi:hypothetical protein
MVGYNSLLWRLKLNCKSARKAVLYRCGKEVKNQDPAKPFFLMPPYFVYALKPEEELKMQIIYHLREGRVN